MRRQQWLMPAVLVLTLTSLNQTSWAVGRVTEQTGPTEIVRDKKSLPSQVNTPVQMNDTIVTAKARAQLTFEDNTTVKITEQSKLIIDDFVYDPKKGSGKVAMKVVLGTARYASGQIAKTNPQNVNVQTPTATVAVRGTDFSMTVDELGRSLVVLLPSCDNRGCVTGAILVKNDAGEVLLEHAYQATLVTSTTTPPSSPVIISVDQNNINNLLIVSPPPEIKDEEKDTQTKTALDINFLNQDLLKYNALDEDELKSYRELDINYLDGELLANMLDLANAQLAADQSSILAERTMLPGYNAASGLVYTVADDEGKLVLRRATSHIAQVTVSKEADAVINITQDSAPLTQQINRGGTTVINIIQK
jgi:hypothetical protein